MLNNLILFNFNKNSNIKDWYIVNDGVMGGLSKGKIQLTDEGYGQFSGHVSLENNGGFTSVRHDFETVNISEYSGFILEIKGDGNDFQFRVKSTQNQQYNYVCTFKTTGEWQTIKIPFSEMYPTYRGYRLRRQNFSGKQVASMAFLIANKKEQDFSILIDNISVE